MTDDDELEQAGLVAQSYTGLFQIRKVIHRFNDIPVPSRQGLRVDQFVAFLVMLPLMLVLFVLIVAPIRFLTGFIPTWDFYLLWFAVPSVLVAFRIGKPMPSGKSVPSTVVSWMRSMLDDPVHRRGVPIKSPSGDGHQVRYWRRWYDSEQVIVDDVDTDFRPSKHGDSEGDLLEHWLDDRAPATAEHTERRSTLAERQMRLNSRRFQPDSSVDAKEDA